MRAISVIGVIWSSGVHSRATLSRPPLVSLGLSKVVGFTRVGPSSVGFILVVGVSRTPWLSLGSCGVVLFTRARLGGHWVHPGSLRSFARALGIEGFIRGLWVHLHAPWGLVEFIRGLLVHLRAP